MICMQYYIITSFALATCRSLCLEKQIYSQVFYFFGIYPYLLITCLFHIEILKASTPSIPAQNFKLYKSCSYRIKIKCLKGKWFFLLSAVRKAIINDLFPWTILKKTAMFIINIRDYYLLLYYVELFHTSEKLWTYL